VSPVPLVGDVAQGDAAAERSVDREAVPEQAPWLLGDWRVRAGIVPHPNPNRTTV
jgi:hypothetical protein